MKRRIFAKQLSVFSVGGIYFPQLLASCKKEYPVQNISYDGKIIIIGAGAAGLYAGYLCKEYGIDFEILEASAVHGGRLRKLEGFADFDVDLGAEWLHGRNSIAGDMVKSTGTGTFKDNADGVFWHNDQLVNKVSVLDDAADDVESSNEDVSYKDYLCANGASDSEYDIIAYLSGEYGASPENISVKWTNREEKEWSSGEDDHKFDKTYYDFINDHIASRVLDNIRYNTVVASVEYGSGKVVIKDSNQNSYETDKVILALPIPVLQDGDISFTPTLPSDKTAAFQKIGIERGMKFFLKFSEKFYDEGIIGGSACAAYVDEGYGRSTNDHVLMGFLMGKKADSLSALGSEAAKDLLLAELDKMYNGAASASYLDHYMQDWGAEQYIRGAYSYSTIGMGEGTRKLAAESVADKLFFAGECMNTNGHHQSVHGAMESGYREILNILKTVQDD